MNEQSELIDNVEDITIILRYDQSELTLCEELKKNFSLIKGDEILNVLKGGVFKCYDQFYLDMKFSVYFDIDTNIYFMISPFRSLFQTPEDIAGLVLPVNLVDNIYGTIWFYYDDETKEYSTSTDLITKTKVEAYDEKYINKLKELFPSVEDREGTTYFEIRKLVRQMAFNKELSTKLFIKENSNESLASDWYIKTDNKKYKEKLELINTAKQLVLDIEMLEAQLKMIENTRENMLEIIDKLSESEMKIVTEKIKKMIDKIKRKLSNIEEKRDDKFINVITTQFTDIQSKVDIQGVSMFDNEVFTEKEIFQKILHEKLVSYNERNPEYLHNNNLLRITQNKINEDEANTNKMKRLYELYKSGTYAHIYNWDKYFEDYMNRYTHGYDIDHILLTNDKVGDDIVGGFLIISNNARDLSHSTYYHNNEFKRRQGREFTQVFITDTYQYSKNSDIPISFSYYLLTYHAKLCEIKTGIVENGWCATQEVSKVYEYMLYNWKYYEKTDVTNILYYDCLREIDLSMVSDHFLIITDSQYLMSGYKFLYQKSYNDSLRTIQVEFPAIHENFNKKYGKKSLYSHIVDEIKRSKLTSRYENQYMTSFMKLANVVIKSLQLKLDKESYSEKEIINLLLLNNIHDQHLFIKLKKIFNSDQDVLLIFVTLDDNVCTFSISKETTHIEVNFMSHFANESDPLFIKFEQVRKTIFEIFSTDFYDIISDTDTFTFLKSHMIKSISDIFTNDDKVLSSYALLDILSSVTPQEFLKKAKIDKIYEAVYSVIKNALTIGSFLTRYYEINKQYNYKKNFRKILETINGAIISKDDLSALAPTFLTDNHRQKYDLFINNLIELIQTKFKYRDEINDFLNIPLKQDMYLQLLRSNTGSSYAEILKIFKATEFGVEFESCFGVTTNQGHTCKLQQQLSRGYGHLNKFIDEFNKLSNKYIPLNEQKQQNINYKEDNGQVAGESYSAWRLHVDPTINCPVQNTYAIEVVTPILQFSDSDNKASGKDEMWKTISRKLYRENFGRRYEYSDGLFFLITSYNFLLNNTIDKQYKENIKIKTYANQSQGMHLHVSNPNMMLETTGDKFCGLGALKMIYFIRMFAYFEHVIRNFLDRPPALNSYWAKSIYYNREMYLRDTHKHVGLNDKQYIEDTTYSKLKNYIRDPTANQTFIAEMFETYRDNLLVKMGRQYGGAFAIKIYNGRGKCHFTNALKNLCCKGHLEIRLHHSTDNFAEVYNWVLFINLFLSKCINEVDQIYEARHNISSYDEVFDKIMEKYKTFPTTFENPDTMKVMFDDLFDNFIQNDTLKKFYKKRCKESSIKDSPHTPSSTQLELHTPLIFTSDGELKDKSILKEMMSVFPLDSDSTTSREDLIKTIKTIDVKEQENDYNLIN